MFDPLVFPYVRAQNYADNAPPQVLSDEFYNPAQDAIARLFGGLVGQSTSLATDEFERPFVYAVALAGGELFGEQFQVLAAPGPTNMRAQSQAPSLAGDHGVARCVVDAGAAAANIAVGDNSCFIGASRQYIWVAKVRVLSRARLETVPNEGVMVGLGDTTSGLGAFVGGNDQANWQVHLAGVYTDTAVPLANDTWYWLAIARQTDGNVRFYIDSGTGWALVPGTANVPGAIPGARRYFRFNETAAAVILDYAEIDHFSRGIER